MPSRTIYQIRNKANYDGLCSRNNLRKYSINKEYFNIPTEENCYWAGFIAADGCIVYDKNILNIGLQHKDKNLLNQFIKDIGYTNEVKVYKNRVCVTINCKEICNDLTVNFNITPRKSKTLCPPNLKDEKIIAYFIKGVIDGDGSIQKDRLAIYGTKQLLEWVKYYFDKWIPTSNYRIANVRKIQAHLYSYKIGTKRKDFIFNKFKKLNCYELKRKWTHD